MITWQDIMAYVGARIGATSLYVRTSGASATGQKDQVTLIGEGGKKVALPARRMGPFGLRWVHPKDCEGLAINVGGRLQLVLLAAESEKYGPTDLEGGEVALYDQAGSTIVLDKDGAITITSKSGATVVLNAAGKITIDAKAGQDVQVNGGTLKVARETDPVDPHGTMSSWIAAVQAVAAAAAPALMLPPPVAPTQFGNIRTGAGATRFKG